jgi:hypothetical protein
VLRVLFFDLFRLPFDSWQLPRHLHSSPSSVLQWTRNRMQIKLDMERRASPRSRNGWPSAGERLGASELGVESISIPNFLESMQVNSQERIVKRHHSTFNAQCSKQSVSLPPSMVHYPSPHSILP